MHAGRVSRAPIVVGLAIFGAMALFAEGAVYVPSGLNRQNLKNPSSIATRNQWAAHAGQRTSTGEPVVHSNFASFMNGNVLTLPVVRVDYRDDQATRMREAGLLDGPLPVTRQEGGVARGGCSFAIECDDGNPCTRDLCTFTPGQPAGSGFCENLAVADGSDGAIGDPSCPDSFGLACGGCEDGVFCNGISTCQSGVCVDRPDPCPGVCSEDFRLCQNAACTTTAQCSQAGVVGAALAAEAQKTCNGAETCEGGVCRAGTKPCGSGAICAEKRCSMTGNPNFPSALNEPCITDTDCFDAGITNSTCSITGPVCQPGRCCTDTTDPVCTRRFKNQGKCAGGGANNAAPCRNGADCANGNCNFTSTNNLTCDDLDGGAPVVPGIFYGGDDGTISGGGGTTCGTDDNDVQVKCPTYGSGIAPSGVYSAILGPMSESPMVAAPFGVALQKLGDDYGLSGTETGFIALDYLRFAGGSPVGGHVSVEFYDASGNFIEDLNFASAAAFGIHPILLNPPLTIPASGFVVMGNAQGFSPNARHVWASTDAVDVGSNDPGFLWVNDGPVSDNFGTTGILAFELEGAEVAAAVGACCNDLTSVCTDGVLPWVCRGAGDNFQGPSTTCPANCATGACCAGDGGCSVTTEAGCTGSFQGFGTDCDTSNGAWGTPGGNSLGEAHCCTQPVVIYSGADDCADVTLHAITAPPAGETRVITVTGNNASASNISGPDQDSCFSPSTDPNADPGWWEGFELVDECTMIYIDHCCTQPVHRPASDVLYRECPCSSLVASVANPYEYPEPPGAYGQPYCAEDDNAWHSFGLLGPGNYYYPVYSGLQGHHGDYQLHITALACPLAACCIQDQCVDEVTQLQCDALGGYFLAPPQRSPLEEECTGVNGQPGSTCHTGSCCTGPGSCVDVFLGSPFTKADCDALQGSFVGGVRCQGGSCASTPVESCASNQDCPNSDCVGDAQALAQPLPCPICEIEGANHCQSFENVHEFTISDRSVGFGVLAADDFTPQGSTLSEVCVWGFYLNFDPDAPPEENDCSGDVTTDHFRVRVYDNDPVTGRVPRNLVGESMATSDRGIVPNSVVRTRFLTDVYGFQLSLNSPISGLKPGEVYWLEVSNDVTDSHPSCIWHWMRKTPTSSSLSFVGDENGYEPMDEVPAEQAFCLNFDISPSTIGALDGPCCGCQSNDCFLSTLYECLSDNGVWDITRDACDGVTCSLVPTNNHCGHGPPMITAGVHSVDNRCASTDGYNPIPSDFGNSSLESDLWFYYIAPSTSCNLVVSECATGIQFDSMLAVYHNPDDPTVCPPCPLSATISEATLAGIAQDESCSGGIGGPGLWICQDQLGRDTLPGECFLLRIGSFGNDRGVGTLDISCGGICRGCGIPQPVVADTVNKSRFVSFTIPNNLDCTGNAAPYSCCTGVDTGNCDSTGETAIRVVFNSMHVVVPPYSGGPTVSFNAFAGQYVYVGPPAVYTENGDPGGTPFRASFTQCMPHFQNWSTVGLLHVTGPQIVPSSNYGIEHLAAGCLANPGAGECAPGGNSVSAAAEIRTTRWGDVRTPYNPPDPSVQPDISDVSALVDKFRNVPNAPIKARALQTGIPGNSWGQIDAAVLGVPFGFGHISSCVDAFRGTPYPFRPGKCAGAPTPPNSGACRSTSDCGGNNGAGPCNLYCP